MEPVFFSRNDQPLFGIYHPPQGKVTKNKAVLICYPFFKEYIITHRALRFLADQLSMQGCHVFRFDYYGTGDSSGALETTSLDTWRNNIHEAENELKEISGLSKISIVGIRYGALLAAQHVSSSVNEVILWDPVISGDKYIDTLSAMQKSILTDFNRYMFPRKDVVENNSVELFGFNLSTHLVSQIKQSNIYNELQTNNKNISLLVSEESIDLHELQKHLINNGVNINYIHEQRDNGWESISTLVSMPIPYETLNIITKLLTK